MTDTWKPYNGKTIQTTSEFAFNLQLTAHEYDILKVSILEVFRLVIARELDPYKRTILLSRVVQESGVIVSTEAVKYSLEQRRNTFGEAGVEV